MADNPYDDAYFEAMAIMDGEEGVVLGNISKERRDVYTAMAWARVWKQAAKKWRDKAAYFMQVNDTNANLLVGAQATADRRLALLIRAMNALEGWRILLDMPVTDIMQDIEKELADGN